MNTRPPTQPPAPLPATLNRAVTVATDWQQQAHAEHQRAEHLHDLLNRIHGLTEHAATGHLDPATTLHHIRDLTRHALTQDPR